MIAFFLWHLAVARAATDDACPAAAALTAPLAPNVLSGPRDLGEGRFAAATIVIEEKLYPRLGRGNFASFDQLVKALRHADPPVPWQGKGWFLVVAVDGQIIRLNLRLSRTRKVFVTSAWISDAWEHAEYLARLGPGRDGF